MLAEKNRIKKKQDFEVIFKKAQKAPQSFKNNLFIFKVVKNELGVSRFGFVVSKKISNKAIIRNKVKRRLAEAINAEAKEIKSGADVVLIALPGIEKKEFSDIKKAVGDALIKAKLTANI